MASKKNKDRGYYEDYEDRPILGPALKGAIVGALIGAPAVGIPSAMMEYGHNELFPDSPLSNSGFKGLGMGVLGGAAIGGALGLGKGLWNYI